LQSNPNFRVIDDDGTRLVRVPAVVPDVAIIHVQRASEDGGEGTREASQSPMCMVSLAITPTQRERCC